MNPTGAEKSTAGSPAIFASTHWSVVLACGRDGSPRAAESLEVLCRTYWKPLYVFLRGRGQSVHDAEDLTQSFLAHLLEHKAFGRVAPEKGRFRAFLLASLKNFLINEWDKACAQKRGGGATHVPLDDPGVERLFRLERVDELTPEKLYERRWALTVLEQARERLHADYAAAGKADRFEQLNGFLPGEHSVLSQAEAAARLGLTEGAAKTEVHRMKQRYREHLRAEIAHTVERPEDIDEELRHLVAVISG